MNPLRLLFFPIVLLATTFVTSCGAGPNAASADQRPPNVLLILTDDQGYGDLSLHGNDSLQTPVLDRFATGGVRLDNFFVSAVCAPTRASLLTGRYHLRTGTFWVTRGTETMRSEEITLAEVFRENGYATGLFGKWHNGAHYPNDPLGQGFDHFTGFSAGHWNNYFDSPLFSDRREIRTKGYIADVLTDSAMAFMKTYRDRPFFCYVPLNTPHTPYQVPDRYFDKYKALGLDDERACAYAMVENIDDNVGRMLAQLESLQLRENTIVIFLTDNGPQTWRYNAGMKGKKAWVNDGGTRVPFFIQWGDRLPAGRIVRELTAHIDLLPTLVDLCGIQMPKTLPLDGVSMAALIRGKVDTLPARALFTHYNHADAGIRTFPGAMRTREYRFVARSEEQIELTSMRGDPAESENLTAQFPEIVASMKAAYLAWFADVTRVTLAVPPIPVGYPQIGQMEIPAHEAFLSGEVHYKFSKNGYANDWIEGWRSPSDTLMWEVEAAGPVDYEIWIKYAAKEEDTGSLLRLQAGTQVLISRIEKPFKPQVIVSPDRAIRTTEAYDQSWTTQKIGELHFDPGTYRLVLTAQEIPGSEVGEIKGLILKRKDG